MRNLGSLIFSTVVLIMLALASFLLNARTVAVEHPCFPIEEVTKFVQQRGMRSIISTEQNLFPEGTSVEVLMDRKGQYIIFASRDGESCLIDAGIDELRSRI